MSWSSSNRSPVPIQRIEFLSKTISQPKNDDKHEEMLFGFASFVKQK